MPTVRILQTRPWTGPHMSRGHLVPPRVGDPAELLQLAALAASKRWPVASCHDDQVGELEGSPSDVAGPDKPGWPVDKDKPARAPDTNAPSQASLGGLPTCASVLTPLVDGAEKRAPLAGESRAHALSEHTRECCRAARLGEEDGGIERVAARVGGPGHEVAHVLHLHAGEL